MYTMNNADLGGASGGTISINLTNYALKEDTATKEEFNKLVDTVANKLDKSPQHHHKISEIDELQTELNAKYDKNNKYSYNVILSDSEKIPLLENTKIINLDIAPNKNTSGYVLKVDSTSGDLQILKNNVVIMSYNSALNRWLLNGIDIYDVLQNHTEAFKNIEYGCDKLIESVNNMFN